MAEVIPMRKEYGEALVSLGQSNENVVALSADVANMARGRILPHES